MALDFDGVDDTFSKSANPMTNTDDFAMGGWFKKDANPSSGQVAVLMQNGHNGGSGSGYEIRLYDDGSIAADIGFVAGFTTATVMNTTDWYHIVVRRFDSRYRCYINGVIDAGSSEFATPNTPSNGLWIGSGNDSGTPNRFFNGKCAECFCYSVAPSAEVIAALAAGFSPLFFPQNLASYLPCGGAFPVLRDLPRSAHMTLSGAVDFDHPRIVYPATMQQYYKASAGAPAYDYRKASFMPFFS